MRLILFVTLVVLINLLELTRAPAQSRVYPPNFAGTRTEIYKRVDDVELKLWVFEPPRHQPGDRKPAIVFFFGGGWKSGNPGQFEHHCRYLASQGMVAMTVDYRVLQRHGTLADKSVSDAKSAIRWVRQNAERLGIDPGRIVAAGGSAGGHLAACTGVITEFDEPGERSDISSVPNALALFNPALLLVPLDNVGLSAEQHQDIATRTGVSALRISPIHHVRPGLPPTIIFHGEADSTVPFATVRRYAELALAAGNRCELIGYPDVEHGFFNYGRDGDPGEFYLTTLHRLHRYLHSLGYLDNMPAITVPAFKNVHLRSHFDHSRAAFAQEKKGTVAFIGGSITEMNGYRLMVQSLLRKRFPDTEFQFINAGISSTCSTTGAFRLGRDVLAADPDLLFVEYAVNDDQDAEHAERECIRGMEGILRQARIHNSQIDIVLTHFINPPMLELLQQDQTPVSIGAHESVARRYGVSTVNLAREVATRVSEGELTWKEYGGTHPAEAGNRIAAEMIENLLATAWSIPSGDPTQTADHPLPKAIDSNSYWRGRLIDVTEAKCDEHWTIERPDWSKVKGSVRERFEKETMLCASQVGAELTFRFQGSAVGIYLLAGPDAGSVEYSIDEGPIRTVDLYHRFSKGLHYPRTVIFAADLSHGDHALTMRIGQDRSGQSGGHAVRILNFVVN